ncbi:MAG: tyrosine-type recombinase/integrase [Lachnospiraceae bacterium]|nr:tyrosine-type recombinase/integrase [Lachnospiraceae bacterium]
MKEKKSNAEILYELVECLPDFCKGYLIVRANDRSMATRIGYARNLKTFFEYVLKNVKYFQSKSVKDILPSDMEKLSVEDLDLFIGIYSEDHEKPTIARMKSSISSMYQYLANTLRAISYNPVLGVQRVDVPKKDYVVYLNLQEQEQLLNTIIYGTGLTEREKSLHKRYVKRDLAMVFLLLDTGLRASELQGADNKDVDLSECSIIVTRKGGSINKVYFSDEAAEYLKDYMQEKERNLPLYNRPGDPLIISEKGTRLTVRQYENIVPKYVNAALPDRYGTINCHKLRSSFAMEFYMRDPKYGGHDILALQNRMNHKRLETTNIYAKAANNVSKETRNWREHT